MQTDHYGDVIMGTMATQITSLTIVFSTIYSGTYKKHQSSASLALVRGIHRWPVNSPHKGPVTGKMFPFDDVIMDRSAQSSTGPIGWLWPSDAIDLSSLAQVWLVAWRHQAITWTSVDWSSVRPFGIDWGHFHRNAQYLHPCYEFENYQFQIIAAYS